MLKSHVIFSDLYVDNGLLFMQVKNNPIPNVYVCKFIIQVFSMDANSTHCEFNLLIFNRAKKLSALLEDTKNIFHVQSYFWTVSTNSQENTGLSPTFHKQPK
jgi:hypothetical protein